MLHDELRGAYCFAELWIGSADGDREFNNPSLHEPQGPQSYINIGQPDKTALNE